MKKMKFFGLLAAAVLLVSAGCGGGGGTAGQGSKSGEFNENAIVLSFSGMSDVHQQDGHPEYSTKLTNALKICAKLNKKDLDAAVFAGDLTENTWRNTGKEEFQDKFTLEYNCEMELFKEAVSAGVDISRTAVVYTLGNHDSDPTGIGGDTGVTNMAAMPGLFHKTLGDEFFAFDAADGEIDEGRRHVVVNGYHFLTVQPANYWRLNGYSEETLEWLDARLGEITSAEPDKYVFVIAHPPLYETVWGSYASDWSDSAVRTVLEKYPQAFYISGHIHNVLNDETQISQNGYTTSVDCGGVARTGMMNQIADVSGMSFDNDKNSTTHAEDFSQGILIQVDENGNVRILRINFITEQFIKDPWEVSHPMADNSHLLKYDNEMRETDNIPPLFEEGAEFEVTYENNVLNFEWSAATDDDQVRYYKIFTSKFVDGKYVRQQKVYNLATFTYLYDRVEDMPDSYSFSPGVLNLEAGKYKFELYAVDCWDERSSNALTAELTVS